MTNEQLVTLIQKGHNEYITRLWQQVVRFIDMKAGQYLNEYPKHYKQYREDMVNESYFWFLKAVEGHDPDKGAFTTYLAWHLKNAFETVLRGRGEKRHNEPLNHALSLNMTLGDTDDLTLADTLLDEESEAYYRHIEDADFWKSVGRFLEEAIDNAQDLVGAEIVRYMYHHNGCKINAASHALYGNIPVPYTSYQNAIRHMKNYILKTSAYKRVALLGLDDYIPHQGYGLTAYRNNLFTSAVEDIAIRRADVDWKLKDVAQVIG